MKMKVALPALAALASAASAQYRGYGMMGDGYGWGGGGMFLGCVFGLIFVALASAIFSVIFWSVHNWMAKQKEKA